MKIRLSYLLICLSLFGCNNEKKNDVVDDVTSTPSEVIKKLENDGSLPKLDHTDSIKGIDKNNDGIRDDIGDFIDIMPVTSEQKKQINKNARVIQSSLLVDVNDKAALEVLKKETMHSVICLMQSFKNHNEASKISDDIQMYTTNTKLRTLAYFKFNQALSGSVTRMPVNIDCREK